MCGGGVGGEREGCFLISSLRSLPGLHLAGLFGTYRAFCGRRAWSPSRVVWVVAWARPFQDGAAVVCLDQKQQRVRGRRELCWWERERGRGARAGPWAEQQGMMGKLEILLEFTHLSAVIVTASRSPFKACQPLRYNLHTHTHTHAVVTWPCCAITFSDYMEILQLSTVNSCSCHPCSADPCGTVFALVTGSRSKPLQRKNWHIKGSRDSKRKEKAKAALVLLLITRSLHLTKGGQLTSLWGLRLSNTPPVMVWSGWSCHGRDRDLQLTGCIWLVLVDSLAVIGGSDRDDGNQLRS